MWQLLQNCPSLLTVCISLARFRTAPAMTLMRFHRTALAMIRWRLSSDQMWGLANHSFLPGRWPGITPHEIKSRQGQNSPIAFTCRCSVQLVELGVALNVPWISYRPLGHLLACVIPSKEGEPRLGSPGWQAASPTHAEFAHARALGPVLALWAVSGVST